MNSQTKMKVEIWSDIMCPFCYIGKRNFETALAEFSDKDKIEVEWKSFQLDPSLSRDGKDKIQEYMARQKRMSVSEVKSMNRLSKRLIAKGLR